MNFMKNETFHYTGNPEKELKQFQSEIETWKKLLSSRMEENVFLKNQLADILKNNYDQNLLEEIEEFQTGLINQDELIVSFRRDVNESCNLLVSNTQEGKKADKSFNRKMEILRKDIESSTIRYRTLRSNFNEFCRKVSVNRTN